tara:strand:+ start:106 stop:507 length:402 start_codon:yes stop_codon:yes gene_type:complete
MNTVPELRDVKLPSLAEIIGTQNMPDPETKTILKNCSHCLYLTPTSSEDDPICKTCNTQSIFNKAYEILRQAKEEEEAAADLLDKSNSKSGGKKNKKKRKPKKTKRRSKSRKTKRKSKKRRKKKRKRTKKRRK